MTVARITEISASSKSSFDKAISKGIKRATRTLKNVKGAWVDGQKVVVGKDGEIVQYRVTLKVSFILDD